MRVLHIGKYYPPFLGGIEKVNYDLVEGLNKEKVKTDVFCFNHKTKTKTVIEEDSYKIIRTSLFTIKFSTPISLSIFKNLLRIYKDYDIIHIHMPNPIAALAFQFLPYKGKIILHWHLDIVKQKTLKVIYKPFQTHLLKKADAIIVTSLEYLNHSKDLKPFLKKCHVIPIGIDNYYLKENLEFRKKLQQKYQGKKIIFSLGRLIYYKGFEYLIEAAKELDDDCIIFIGGLGPLKESLEIQIQKSDLEDKVKLIGKIPESEIGEYYHSATLFCLPSIERSEAFGIVLVEAMSCGCPLISTAMGSGTSWVNKNNNTGLVVPAKDASEMALAIQKIVKENTLRNTFSKNCLFRFKNEFRLETMIQRALKLYRDMFEKNN